MGAGFVRSIQQVVPSSSAGSSWARRDIGPTLRRFFGAFYNGDVWAVYRRYKNIDVENSGWISYEELSEPLGALLSGFEQGVFTMCSPVFHCFSWIVSGSSFCQSSTSSSSSMPLASRTRGPQASR